ncbi:septum formation family protein [Dactylosporangium cerinum]|uniref:Septum formation family protein n=1 Tax=Dactylosporangium cerinum TaxID=1434730 RepID=A0ABV9WDJ7_9ACTN
MSRFRLVVVLALVLASAAACARVPAGTDKSLVDDWSMLGEAKVPVPATGDCWRTDASDVYDIVDVPGGVVQAPCENSHVIETAYVGQFTGAQADADRAPSLEQLADQYKVCEEEATKYLGGAWASGRLRLLVYPPTSGQWKGGARFFRCDVAALRTEAGILDPRKETLKGTLQPGGSMLLGCTNQVGTKESWSDLTPAACTAAHDTEFVGVVISAIATYPADSKAMDTAYSDRCWAQVRAFTGSPDSVLDKADVRYGYWMMADKDEWASGLRTARCYVMLPKKITRSLKGNGGTAI